MGKVLIYAMLEGKGGIEEFVLNLSRYIKSPEKKYGYIILGNKTAYIEELKELNVEYFFLTPKRRLLKNMEQTRRLFLGLRKEYDTIYFNTSGLFYFVPYLYAWKDNYRIVLHSHLSNAPNFKKWIHYVNRFWINKIVDVKLTCSTLAGLWMFKSMKNVTFVPNAINIQKFQFNNTNRSKYRKKYNLTNSFIIGNIGRLEPVKNQTFLIDILGYMRAEKQNVKLLLVGGGKERFSLHKKVKKMGLENAVIFAGITDHPEEFYSAMDCLVMPSLAEGFPITLIEAQANGLPCVVSDTVTQEANISGHILYQSLNESPQSWSKTINSNRQRYDCVESLITAGFDVSGIESIVSELIR